MNFSFRAQEYIVFFYRLFLVYAFYFLARVFFYLYNSDLIGISGLGEFLYISFRGLSFDTTAILYVNLLFILLSFLPLFINTGKGYQKMVLWVYFTTNLLAYATNFIDFVYYPYTYTRSTVAALESIGNESNKLLLAWSFIVDYWHVFLLFLACAYAWVVLYKRVPVITRSYDGKWQYVLGSGGVFLIVSTLIVGGIRGDFKHSTRPINLVDASRHVKKVEHSDLVLNTPFTIIRTWGKTDFKKRSGIPEAVVNNAFHPIKQYNTKVAKKPNVVILIIESFGREYLGGFNKQSGIKNFESYSPFIDSLAQHSLIFPNAYTNGRKSIHAMSSMLAGIPSFEVAYTSSPYANQKVQSLVSTLREMDYDTSFFHGAPNGSMGFLGFSNVLGFDHYYGKTEYNNDDDFDGTWGIWDEPFLNYTSEVLSTKKEPFMATVMTVSSHAPYNIPEKYKGKFPEGYVAMHKCVGYTDHALKQFFNKISKEPWYRNTIFVLTADHSNQVYYDEYKKTINHFAIPILIYSPEGKYVGEDYSMAQQIDIYPTILDMTGYERPFRSWGRSLVGDTVQKPYNINYSGSTYLFMRDSLICNFSDKEVLGFYSMDDKELSKNLINDKTEKMEEIEQMAKGFLQDYMNRVIDNDLSAQ